MRHGKKRDMCKYGGACKSETMFAKQSYVIIRKRKDVYFMSDKNTRGTTLPDLLVGRGRRRVVRRSSQGAFWLLCFPRDYRL